MTYLPISASLYLMATDRYTIQEVSERLGVSLSTLYTYRTKGAGPRGYRIGKRLYYDVPDVEAYIAAERAKTERGGTAA